MILGIEIPDNRVDEIIDGFAVQYGYQQKVKDTEGEEIDNPVTKAQFARNIIVSFIKEVYVASKIRDIETIRQKTIATAAEELKDVKAN